MKTKNFNYRYYYLEFFLKKENQGIKKTLPAIIYFGKYSKKIIILIVWQFSPIFVHSTFNKINHQIQKYKKKGFSLLKRYPPQKYLSNMCNCTKLRVITIIIIVINYLYKKLL